MAIGLRKGKATKAAAQAELERRSRGLTVEELRDFLADRRENQTLTARATSDILHGLRDDGQARRIREGHRNRWFALRHAPATAQWIAHPIPARGHDDLRADLVAACFTEADIQAAQAERLARFLGSDDKFPMLAHCERLKAAVESSYLPASHLRDFASPGNAQARGLGFTRRLASGSGKWCDTILRCLSAHVGASSGNPPSAADRVMLLALLSLDGGSWRLGPSGASKLSHWLAGLMPEAALEFVPLDRNTRSGLRLPPVRTHADFARFVGLCREVARLIELARRVEAPPGVSARFWTFEVLDGLLFRLGQAVLDHRHQIKLWDGDVRIGAASVNHSDQFASP